MDLNKLVRQTSEKWSSLSTAKKSAALVMGIALVLSLIMLSRWVSDTSYAPLFTDLDARDASAVVEKLKETGVTYKLADQGSTVLVPEDRVYELRLQLASAGIMPTGGMGFELFDETKLGMTDFELRLNYQRALQEELRRTIVAMEEVEQARVHLVIPEPSVFIEEQAEASASVVIKLHPLAKLKPEQVKGIIFLVANSVENLKPENVNVIDMSGNILSEEVVLEGDTGLAISRLKQQELKREFEKNLENRVQRMLERIFGPGKVVTMITADLNFDTRQVTRIEYGNDGVVKSEQIVREESVSNNNSAGGSAGTDSNLTTYPGLDRAGESSNHSSESIQRQYELDKAQETVIYAPGEVERLSTAVTVDGQLTDQQIAQIKELVTAAIGYYPDRGDQITVMSMAFDRSFAEEARAEMEQQAAREAEQKRVRQYIYAALTAFALLLAFILILTARRRAGRLDAAIEDVVPVQDVSAVPIEEEEGPQLDPEKEKMIKMREKKRQDVRKIVEENPQKAAELIRTWLSES